MNLTLQKAAFDAGLSVDFTDPDRFTVSDGVAVVKYLQYPGERVVRIDGTKSAKYLADRFEGLFEVASAARKAIDIQARMDALPVLQIEALNQVEILRRVDAVEVFQSEKGLISVPDQIIQILLQKSEHAAPTWRPFDRSKIPGLS